MIKYPLVFFKERDPLTISGLVLLSLLVLLAIFPLIIFSNDPFSQNFEKVLQAPNIFSDHPLGTDMFGRDIWARVSLGFFITVPLSLLSVFLGGCLGTLVGMYSAYFGGLGDLVTQRFIDAFLSFPALCIGLVIVVVFGTGYWNLVLAIGLVMFPRFTRLARGVSLQIKEENYIEAEEALGSGKIRILFRHLLPNILSTMITQATLRIRNAVIVETGLSFLGLGIQPPTPTWGSMIKDGLGKLSIAPWISVIPGVALTLCILAFFMLGDGLRNELDPRSGKF